MGYRILVINWQDIRNPLGGGAEVHLHEIFKRIAQQGHEVTLLCCLHKELPSEETVDSIKIIRRGNRYFFNYLVPFIYRRLSRRYSFDVVIDDINKIPFYTPLFVKRPLLGIIHHLFGSSIFIEAPLPVALYVTFAEWLIPKMYRTTPMVVVSNSTRQELVEKGFPEDSIDLVYNAVDVTAYQAAPEKKSNQPVVGYLGRIKKYKSVNHLIHAFQKVKLEIPEASLLIVGDGDYLPRLKKLVRDLKLSDSVTFTGATYHQQKIDYLNRMWLMVNPSPKEGWGLTVIEGNACGIPVIAANSPGLRDSVVDGQTGLLYPYGDVDRLAERIITLLKDHSLRNRLAAHCSPWAEKFNWENSAHDMLHAIEKALTRRF
ncbi:MAG: glycosyltransferase family 4 protein [Candidatus Zhuqueibacterota bacterium]